MNFKNFFHKAGLDGILAGASAFLYAYSFLILSRFDPVNGAFFSGLFLLLAGAFAMKPFIALYHRLKDVDPGYAMYALWASLVGALGMVIHGGYDLANAINPPVTTIADFANFPSQIDPRGLLSFGALGMGLLVNVWLMKWSKKFPQGLVYVGFVSGIFLIVLYLGRLIVLNPASPLIAYSALLNGFLVGPLWYIWLGWFLWKGKK